MALTHKQDIAQRFSKAADGYYALACIQNEITALARQYVQPTEGFILDIGCATGEHTSQLGPNVIGVDLAFGMVNDARRKTGRNSWVNGDMDALPFADQCFSHVFSSMALQWTSAPATVLTEIARVLRPNGKATLLIPVSGSFWQLQLAYDQSGLISRLNHMQTADNWLAAIKTSGLGVVEQHRIVRTDYRASLPDLLRSISKIGASSTEKNVAGLTRQDLRKLVRNYPLTHKGYGLDYQCLLVQLEN